MAAPSDSALDHWRSLLAAIAPGVALATVLQGVLDASAAVAIADGSFVIRPGWQSTAAIAIWVLAWTLSLSAAMIVMRGALIDAPVRAGYALRAALRRWGLVLAAILIIGVLIVVLLVLAVLLERVLGPLAFIAFAILAVPLATASVGALPLAVLAPEEPFTAVTRSWELAAGRRWYMIGVSLCVVVPGVAITAAQPRVGSWASGPLTAFLLSLGLALLSVIVVGFQASILARWYAKLDGEQRSPGTRPRPDRWRLGTALLVAAAVTVSVVTVLNPWGVPVLSSSTTADNDRSMLIAKGGTILPDGQRLTVAHEQSNDVVHFEICGSQPYCDTKLLTTFERPGLMWETRGALAVGDGLAIVAVVQQSGGPAEVGELVLWHCPTVACTTTTRNVIYREVPVRGVSLPGNPLLAMDLDSGVRPLIAIASPGQMDATVIRCDDAACGAPSFQRVPAVRTIDRRGVELAGLGFDAQHRLVLALTSGLPPTGQPGPRFGVAEPPVTAAATCQSADCEQRTVQRWDVSDLSPGDQLRPVARPDGSLVLVVAGRSGFWGSSRLIQCESHCV